MFIYVRCDAETVRNYSLKCDSVVNLNCEYPWCYSVQSKIQKHTVLRVLLYYLYRCIIMISKVNKYPSK